MIPAYENATNAMFSQISSSLESGLTTKSDTASLDKLKAMESIMLSMSSSIIQLTKEVESLRATLEASKAVSGDNDSKEISITVEDEILSMLKANNFEAAFTTALSSNNAELAVFACKNADISVVLDEDSLVVSQAILLCLMQQLSASLMKLNNTEVSTELEWLQEIAIVLKPNDQSIAAHAAGVLKQVGQNISAKSAMGDLSRIQKRQLQTLLQVLRGVSS